MERLKHSLRHLDDHLAMATLVVIVVITTAGVFMRYVVGEPFKWTDELSKALMVWFTFLGASTVMRNDDHISIDVLVRRFPKQLRYAFILFRMIVMTRFSCFWLFGESNFCSLPGSKSLPHCISATASLTLSSL